MKSILKFINTQKTHLLKGIKIGLILIGLVYLIILIPYYYTTVVKGNDIISEHKLIYSSLNNTDELALKSIEWTSESMLSPYAHFEAKFYNKYGIYNMNGTWTYFFRSSNLAWLIKTRLGNCGERADYFIQILNEFNISARKVCVVEDHCWAEYYSDGTWISVEPNTGEVIIPFLYGDTKNWSSIRGVYLNQTKIDLTKRYLNTSTITIKKLDNKFLNSIVKYEIYSTVLLVSDSKRYPKPNLIETFYMNEDKQLKLGVNPQYLQKIKVNLGIVSFEKEEEFKLTEDITISIYPNELFKLQNIKFKRINLLILLIISVILFFYLMNKSKN